MFKIIFNVITWIFWTHLCTNAFTKNTFLCSKSFCVFESCLQVLYLCNLSCGARCWKTAGHDVTLEDFLFHVYIVIFHSQTCCYKTVLWRLRQWGNSETQLFCEVQFVDSPTVAVSTLKHNILSMSTKLVFAKNTNAKMIREKHLDKLISKTTSQPKMQLI